MSVGADRAMPVDGVIQVAFDRYLLPETTLRQAVVLADSANNALPPELQPRVLYDPITRTITIARPAEPWLVEGQSYHLLFPIPPGDTDSAGLRAIDRATLFADQKRDYAFSVGPKTGAAIEPQVSFCRDVLPIFTAKCSLPTCHGSGDRAAASLVLDTSAGVGATTLGRVAQGSNRGPRAGATSPGPLFGVDMPIIDPGSPGNSWLMYKVDLARLPPARAIPTYACTAGLAEQPVKFVFSPLVPQFQAAADDIERSILSDFILGREMPFPIVGQGSYEEDPLTFDEREKIRIWIGSLPPTTLAVPECGGCGLIPEATDGGITEAGATDAAGAGDAADASDAADQ